MNGYKTNQISEIIKPGEFNGMITFSFYQFFWLDSNLQFDVTRQTAFLQKFYKISSFGI